MNRGTWKVSQIIGEKKEKEIKEHYKATPKKLSNEGAKDQKKS